MRACISLALVALLFAATASADPRPTPDPAGPNVNPPDIGQRLGEQVDRGLNTLGEHLRRGWAEIRQMVDELSVQGRVYGRLHWDKALANAKLDISVDNAVQDNTVTLSGSVPDEAARTTALNLAKDTVGVGRVVDHLTISAATAATATPQH